MQWFPSQQIAGTTAMQRRPERISAVESHLGYWLHYVGYRVSLELRRKVQEFGVTAAEWVVLRTLYDEGFKPTHLALRLGLTRGAVSKLAARLEAKGLIDREKSLSDRRSQLLTLTGLGRALVPILASLADQIDARNFGRDDFVPRETIERVMKWVVRRDRFRFVPPVETRR
jgi:DNA-binding MarR family transcriptional regulator